MIFFLNLKMLHWCYQYDTIKLNQTDNTLKFYQTPAITNLTQIQRIIIALRYRKNEFGTEK